MKGYIHYIGNLPPRPNRCPNFGDTYEAKYGYIHFPRKGIAEGDMRKLAGSGNGDASIFQLGEK